VNGSHFALTTVGDTLGCQQLAILTPDGDIASPTWDVAGWEGTKITGTINSLTVQDSVLMGCANGVFFSVWLCNEPLRNVELSILKDELVVYPNPATNKFQIKCKNPKSKKELYNTIGELIFSTNENEIDVSRLVKGMYYLKIESQIRKVIVEIK
jgi:hypothetical protein